jgi:hypothetical protein
MGQNRWILDKVCHTQISCVLPWTVPSLYMCISYTFLRRDAWDNVTQPEEFRYHRHSCFPLEVPDPPRIMQGILDNPAIDNSPWHHGKDRRCKVLNALIRQPSVFLEEGVGTISYLDLHHRGEEFIHTRAHLNRQEHPRFVWTSFLKPQPPYS